MVTTWVPAAKSTKSGAEDCLTTNHGVPVSDNQNSLKGGRRGPTLLEDFVLREKIQHFDHERIPERIVHARGSAAHGFFELTSSLGEFSRAKVLTEVGQKTEVFARFSTVAGGAGSVDTPRDVRGFAVKFYTKEGNWDLVGNNIPVLLAGSPSVVFDAVALVLSQAGCAELMSEGAAIDFAKDAFGHLKAIGFTSAAKPLLDKAGVMADAGVIDLSAGAAKFIEQAKTRQWDREPKVRLLA